MVHCADLFIATDISDYVDYIEKIMQPFIDSGLFRGGRCDRVNFRPVTKYEQIAIDEGREVVDFHYICNMGKEGRCSRNQKVIKMLLLLRLLQPRTTTKVGAANNNIKIIITTVFFMFDFNVLYSN